LLPASLRSMVEMLPRLESPQRRCRSSCRLKGRAAQGSRYSPAALPMPCSAPRIGHGPRAARKRLRRHRAAQQTCCGAIHLHAGASAGARKLADANLAAFKLDELDAIVVNVAGCGAMLKEYGHH